MKFMGEYTYEEISADLRNQCQRRQNAGVTTDHKTPRGGHHMNDEEDVVFEQVLDALHIPEPDQHDQGTSHEGRVFPQRGKGNRRISRIDPWNVT